MKTILDVPSQKSIYIWNIVGSSLNSLLSVFLMVFVTRLLNNNQSDIFSIAWAFGMQASVIGIFQVRLYQATDVKEKYDFFGYRRFRWYTVIAMAIYSVVYVLYKGYAPYKVAVVLLICFGRAVEAFSDVYQGWFQQKERLDLAGKAQTVRFVFNIFAFSFCLYVFNNLLLGCVCYAFSHIISFFLTEEKYYMVIKREYPPKKENASNSLFKLALSCLPLFLNAFIINSIFNIPKFSIDRYSEIGFFPAGTQTDYSILFMPASVLNLAFIVFRPLITSMAIEWNTGKKREYFRIIQRIALCLFAFAIIIMVGSWFFGCHILSLIYKADLYAFRIPLLLLIIGGIFNTFMYLLDNAITVIRKQSYLIISYALTWLYTKLVAPVFVKNMGITGAAITFSTAMILLFICTLIIFIFAVRSKNSKG